MAIGDGANVGDVHLEGHLEYDGSRTPAFMAAMRRDVNRHLPDIGKDLQKTFSESTEKGLTEGGTKGLTALEKKLKGLNVKTPNLDVPVTKALADIDRVEAELKELGRTAATAKIKIDSESALGDLGRLRKSLSDSTTSSMKQRVNLDIDVDKDEQKYRNVGAAVGKFLAVGASLGFKDHARLIRDAMVVGGVAAAGAAIVGLAGVIQAAFAIAPAALVAMPALFLGLGAAAGVAYLALKDFKMLFVAAFTVGGVEMIEKINEKLKGLVPQAREFFLELAANNGKAFQDMQAVAQNEFYIPLKDNAAGVILLFQSLKDEVGFVAGKLGELASRMMNVATSASGIHAFEAVMKGAGVFIDTVSPAFARLFDAILTKAREGAGYAESFGQIIVKVLDYITNWLNSNKLSKLFEDAKPALEDIWRIIQAVWGILKNIFGGDWATGGGGPLEMFADIAEALERASLKVREFVEMIAGLPPHVKELIGYGVALAALSIPLGGVVSWFSKTALHARDFALGLAALGIPLGTTALVLGGIVLGLGALAAIFIVAWTRSEEFREKIRQTFTEIKEYWTTQLWPALQEIGKSFGEIFVESEKILAEFGLNWGDLGTAIQISVRNIMGFITLMTDSIKFGLEIIKGQLALARLEIDAFKAVWETIGPHIEGQLAFTRQIITEFVGFLHGEFDISGLLGPFKNAWGDVKNFLVNEVFEPIKSGLRQVGEAFESLFSGLGGGGGLQSGGAGLSRFFSDLRSTITGFVNDIRGAWDALVSGIRDRLGDIQSAIQGFADGLRSRFDSAKQSIAEFANGWQGLVNGVRDRLTDVQNAIQGFADSVGSRFGAAKAAVQDFLQNAWQALVDGVRSRLTQVQDAIQGFAEGLGARFDAAKARVQAFLESWQSLVTGVRERLADVQNAVSDFASGLASRFDDAISRITSFRDLFPNLRDVVADAIQGVKDTVSGLADFFKNNVFDPITSAIATLKESFSTLFSGLGGQSIDSGGITSFFDSIRTSIQEFVTEVEGAWNRFREITAEVFSQVQSDIQSAWSAIEDTVFSSVSGALSSATDAFNNFRTDVSSAMEGVRSDIESAWGSIQETVFNAVSGALSEATDAFNDFRSNVTTVWDGVRSDIESAWSSINETVFSAVSDTLASASDAFNQLRTDVASAWDGIRSDIEGAWNSIRTGVFEPLMTFLRDTLAGAFNTLKDTVIAAWNAMREGINTVWTNIRDSVFGPVQAFLRDTLGPAFNTFKDTAVASWTAIKTGIEGAWNNIRTAVLEPAMNFIKGPLVQAFDGAKNTIVGIWETLFRGMEATWNKIVSMGRDKMNGLIDLINAVIDIVNRVPFITKIDRLGRIGAPAAGAPAPGRSAFRAAGGPVEGGPLGTDTVPAWGPNNTPYKLDNGEHIWTKKEVLNAGGHSAIYKMREQFRSRAGQVTRSQGTFRDGLGRKTVRMAAGGRVGGENEGLLQSHRDHVHVAMNGAPMSYPNIIKIGNTYPGHSSPTSTYRPGSRGSGGGLDHHSTGKAVDWGGFNQDGFAQFWQKTPGVIELIHRTNTQDYAIFGGGGGGGSSWLATEAGKIIMALIDKAFAGFKAALPKPDGIVGNVINAIFSKIPEQLKAHFEAQVSANGPQAAGGNPDPAVMQNAFSRARGMGANAKVLLALFETGFVESGFKNLGHQGSANDHDSLGFLQQRPSQGWPNPMDVGTATASFVSRAMLIQGLHSKAGSLAQAVQRSAFPDRYAQNRDRAVTELKKLDPKFDPNGYDTGGALPTGSSLIYNNTGRPETVLNPRHSDFVGRVLSGENLLVENHLYVDGEPIRAISRQEVHVREQQRDRIDQAGVRR